ncbi:MAG: hypothetical protein JXO22_14280 [Phycisphaerae bacterium]|nr:hypothetical protein [Phycisphaerae bacterium]
MLEINPLASEYGVNRPTIGSDQSKRSKNTVETTPQADTVEVSEVTWADEGDVAMRDDLVARVRAEIEAGTYLTREKVEGAVDALLSTLAIRDT